MTGSRALHTPATGPSAAQHAPEPSVSFELDGRRCRIVCVDDLVPSQSLAPGTTRMCQRYRPDEVVHFQLGPHRYALVSDDLNGHDAGHPELNGAPRDIHALLTNRELQIVQLICAGLLTKQVGDRLRISEFTVRSYLKTIYCKLGVRSRGAMVYAYAQSFVRRD